MFLCTDCGLMGVEIFTLTMQFKLKRKMFKKAETQFPNHGRRTFLGLFPATKQKAKNVDSQATEPLNVTNMSKYSNGMINERIWTVETVGVSAPFLCRCQVRKAR